MSDIERIIYLFSMLGKSKDFWEDLQEYEWIDEDYFSFHSGLTFEECCLEFLITLSVILRRSLSKMFPSAATLRVKVILSAQVGV